MDALICRRHQPAALALALYSGLVSFLTIGDRWAHKTFATSEFCSNPELVREAGYYGALHCAHHTAAWHNFSEWWSTFWGFLVPLPAFGERTSFLLLHTWANLVGWANTIVTLALIGSLGFLALKLYAQWWYAGNVGKTC